MMEYQYFMQDFKFNILGSEWTVKFGTVEEYPNLEDMDGYTDSSTREIIVDDMKSQQDMPGSKKNMEEYKKQVVRHEIIHAFLCESGLDTNSGACDNWAINEEMVDWFAIQSPKIFKAFNELELM